jgi:hypothetical protein
MSRASLLDAITLHFTIATNALHRVANCIIIIIILDIRLINVTHGSARYSNVFRVKAL